MYYSFLWNANKWERLYIVCWHFTENIAKMMAQTSSVWKYLNRLRLSMSTRVSSGGFLCGFLAFDFCRFCVVIRFFHPRHNGQWPRFNPLHLLSCLNSWERPSIFPFECSVLNKGTTGTIFITSLVWRGPWLGIEPGTSHTRSQHYKQSIWIKLHVWWVLNCYSFQLLAWRWFLLSLLWFYLSLLYIDSFRLNYIPECVFFYQTSP